VQVRCLFRGWHRRLWIDEHRVVAGCQEESSRRTVHGWQALVVFDAVVVLVAVVDVIEVRGRGGKRWGEGEEGGRGVKRGGGRGGKKGEEGGRGGKREGGRGGKRGEEREEGGRGGEDVLAVEIVRRRGRRRGRLRGRRIGRRPVLRSARRTYGIDRILIPCVRQRIYLSA
jgi:hypothetical protein